MKPQASSRITYPTSGNFGLEAASRRERAAEMRRDVLRMNLGQADGVNVAEELARDRADEF